LKYKLKRLVCNSEIDAHIVILGGVKSENITIVPKTFMFFKTSVGNHNVPPGFLTINYVVDPEAIP
jgi:hypothetical protein